MFFYFVQGGLDAYEETCETLGEKDFCLLFEFLTIAILLWAIGDCLIFGSVICLMMPSLSWYHFPLIDIIISIVGWIFNTIRND